MNRKFTLGIAAAVLGLAAALTASPSAMAQPAAAITDHTASTDGFKLHYLQAGQGTQTPIVLLHGYAETSRMWRPVMARLAQDRSVIAFDLPGAGGSDKTLDAYTKKLMAQKIHAQLQALGIKQVRIVGHDIGLMVAYAYAAQYPDEVERIVLMDAFLPGVGDWTKVWLLRDLWHFHFHGKVPEQLVAGRERIYFEHFWNDFAADAKHSVPEADRRFYAKAYGQPGGMHAGFGYFVAFEQDAKDFAEFARTPLTMPMMVLSGEKAGGQFLIDQGKLVDTQVDGRIIQGSGHWLMEEKPEPTMAALQEFLLK